MGFISYAQKNPVYTFHPKNPALQDSILVFNQDCELVSQLPKMLLGKCKTIYVTFLGHVSTCMVSQLKYILHPSYYKTLTKTITVL